MRGSCARSKSRTARPYSPTMWNAGAMEAGLDSIWFYAALAFALLVAGAAAFPIDRWLIGRGKRHAVVHRHHASSV
jgi:hypothetical protein